jgi:acetyl esterase/lipase
MRKPLPFARAVLLALAAVPACRLNDVPFYAPADPRAGELEVHRARDFVYDDTPGVDHTRHRLDLYLPAKREGYPVVVLVHGGAWVLGDNRCIGLYPAVAEWLARQGIGVALPTYRRSPEVQHPEHVKDVAKAFAWVRRHIGAYGGRADQVFLAGHSAGGHLVALLATDERYLRDEGLSTADVKGVIGVSGVYRIPPEASAYALGGASPQAFWPGQLVPFRGTGSEPPGLSLLSLRIDPYRPAFGDSARDREEASPVYHVRPGLPPFLLFSAEHDLPTLPGMAEEMHQALRSAGCASELVRVKGRNHNSIMFRAIDADDPVARRMVEFVRRHAPPQLP